MLSQKPTVQYVRLGKTGLRVSVPILGCMSFGSHEWIPWVIDEEKALEVLKAAWDRGITTLDTANAYSNGESERIIGKFMKKFNIPREKLVILTKCSVLVAEEMSIVTPTRPDLVNTRNYVNQSGLSRAAIFNAVDASLSRLDTDYIDLLQVRGDPNTPLEESMCALNDLVRAGKVRYIGVSNMWAWQVSEYNHVAEKHGWTQFVSMQHKHNLLYREEEREMIPYCKSQGIGLIPYGVLSHGALARSLDRSKHDSDTTSREGSDAIKRVSSEIDTIIISRVEELAERHGVKMAQIAIAWSLTKDDSPIIGVSSVARLEDAIPVGVRLSDEELKYLEEPYKVKPVVGI